MSDCKITDHLPSHPLQEKLVHNLTGLRDIKVVIEGLDAVGNVLRLRSAGSLDPSHLSLVTITPLDEASPLDPIRVPTAPEETHIVLAARFLPDSEEHGVLYYAEQLQDREL